MGKVISLGSAQEYNEKAKILFKRSYVEKCRKACFKEYFIDEDEPEFEVPKDATLGSSADNPA